MFKPLVALPRRSRWKERAQPQLAGSGASSIAAERKDSAQFSGAWEAGNMTQIVGNATHASPSILRIGQKPSARWCKLE